MAKSVDVDMLEMLCKTLADKMRPAYLSADRRSVDSSDWKDEGEKCVTQQHFKEKLDINNIVKSYTAMGYNASDFQGLAQRVMSDARHFVDISEVNDVFEAQQLAQQAQESFLSIPAKIREQFDNDPSAFYSFASNPANAEKINAMFSDQGNFAPPTADQLTEGASLPSKANLGSDIGDSK